MGLTRPQAEWWPANTWVRLGPKSEAMIGRQGFMWVKCAKTAHTFTAQPRPAEDAPKEALAALADAEGEPPKSREEAVFGNESPCNPCSPSSPHRGSRRPYSSPYSSPLRRMDSRGSRRQPNARIVLIPPAWLTMYTVVVL